MSTLANHIHNINVTNKVVIPKKNLLDEFDDF